MSKKTIKILSIVLTIAIVLTTTLVPVFAESTAITKPSDVVPDTNVKGADKVGNVGKGILGIIQVVGTIVSVGILMVLGIKYMMGSAEEKASYKKTMIPYVVGAVLIFGASNLAQYVFEFAESLKDTTETTV